MRKILSQDEIDALFSAAQQTNKAAASQKQVKRYDIRRSSQLTADQVHVVTTLHESLARRLGNSLGAYLRVGFEMNLVSAEQLTYNEFLGRVPELTYFASLHLLPLDARAAFQADLSLVFPIVDLVLGGSGADPIEPRDLTEIEEQIFEAVVALIAHDLQLTSNVSAPMKDVQAELEKALAPEIRDHVVELKSRREGLIVSLREIGSYESGSSTLRASSEDAISRLVSVLKTRSESLRIEGHTDDQPIHNGHFASNWELSTARAADLIKVFIVRYGFDPRRLSAAGYGEFHPVAPNDSREGRARNRRVEFVVLNPIPTSSSPPDTAPSPETSRSQTPAR
jgi:flagellar motor protein MotB